MLLIETDYEKPVVRDFIARFQVGPMSCPLGEEGIEVCFYFGYFPITKGSVGLINPNPGRIWQ